VTLDVSTTTLNDPTDQIVYFTWDFGDGTWNIKKNLSQAVMQHTYRYDSKTENGLFNPKITIKTKKWLTSQIWLDNPIIVKKQVMTLKINIDSHPWQLAKLGDRVYLSLEINGLPKKINWDFGNDKTLECSTRGECGQTSVTYDQEWDYTIKAKVSYDDKPEIEWTVNIKVK
jgi:hypothetical protein